MNSYEDDDEFLSIIRDLITNDKVKQMMRYRHHCDVSTYKHCINVSYISYLMCKKLRLDYVSVARAGMLHDLFLYDWRDKRPFKGILKMNAFTHPKVAIENAEKICNLNEKEKDIIVKHMWPVTFFLMPRYAESFIVTIADKYCALSETKEYIIKKRRIRKAYIISYLISEALMNATVIFE